MIRFKCVYCGQRILVPDIGAGKKGKCPKCNHLLTVPESTKVRSAVSSVKEPMLDRPKDPPVYDVSDEKDALTELVKESFGFLVPTYDRLSIFLMAVIWILLYIVNNQLNATIQTFLISQHWLFRIYVLIVPATFLIIGIYQVFIKREKSEYERDIMLWFAIVTNVFTGIVASVYIIKNTDVHNWQLIFPIWNIVNAVILYLMVVTNFIDENCIVDRPVASAHITLGMAAIVVIVLICNYVFKLHWAITFSICIIYTTSFDRALQSVFPGLYREDYASRDEVKP
jgi:hypothetical protein